MITIDIPNLPGMTPNKDKWLFRQSDGFKKTKEYRPSSAAMARSTSMGTLNRTMNIDKDDWDRPNSAADIRKHANLTPMMEATMSRPHTAMGRVKSDPVLKRAEGIYGASVANIGLVESTGRPVSASQRNAASVPSFVEQDKLVARVYGHFNQRRQWDEGPLGVPNIEESVVRQLTILFHMYDQTIEMYERKMANSGMLGGPFCKRRKLKKTDGDFVKLADLAPGNVLQTLGQEIHITDADAFTRDYFRKQLHMQLPHLDTDDMEAPRIVEGAMFATGLGSKSAVKLPDEAFSVPKPGSSQRPFTASSPSKKGTKSTDYDVRKESLEKTNRFLRYDGQILRFQCLDVSSVQWGQPTQKKKKKHGGSGGGGPATRATSTLSLAPDGTLSWNTATERAYQLTGEEKRIGLLYYLSDGSMEVRMQRDHRPTTAEAACVVKRGKVAKNWREMQRGARPWYYEPGDLLCGKVIDIYGKKLLIVSCNEYTRRVYEDLGVEQSEVAVRSKPETVIEHRMPPVGEGFLNIGSPEDTMATIYGNSKPGKDMMKSQRNQNRTLRCKLKYVSVQGDAHGAAGSGGDTPHRAEASAKNDMDRMFMLTYFLEDDTLQIYEDIVRNSGYMGGMFLKRGKYQNHLPDDSQQNGGVRDFKAQDIYTGNIISINGHEMIITEMDALSIRFCEAYVDEFPLFDAYKVIERNIGKFVDRQVDLRSEITQKSDVERKGYVGKHAIMNAFASCDLLSMMNEQEILTLLRYCSASVTGTLPAEGDGTYAGKPISSSNDIFYYPELCDLISQVYAIVQSSGTLSTWDYHEPTHRVKRHCEAEELSSFFDLLRKKKSPWRRLIKKEVCVGNYITLDQVLLLWNKQGVPVDSIISSVEKNALRRCYGLPTEQAKLILEKLNKKLEEAAESNSKLLKDDSKTLLLHKEVLSPGEIASNRRKQLMQTIMESRLNEFPPSPIRTSREAAAAAEAAWRKTQLAASNVRTVINYHELCDDLYVCDWV